MFVIYLKKNISSTTWDSCRNILTSKPPCITSLIFPLIFAYGIRHVFPLDRICKSELFISPKFNRGMLSYKFKFILSKTEGYLGLESLEEDLTVCSIDRYIKNKPKVIQIKARNKLHFLTVRIINLWNILSIEDMYPQFHGEFKSRQLAILLNCVSSSRWCFWDNKWLPEILCLC